LSLIFLIKLIFPTQKIRAAKKKERKKIPHFSTEIVLNFNLDYYIFNKPNSYKKKKKLRIIFS